MQATREFLAEIKVLTRVHHLNLVRYDLNIMITSKYFFTLRLKFHHKKYETKFVEMHLAYLNLVNVEAASQAAEDFLASVGYISIEGCSR